MVERYFVFYYISDIDLNRANGDISFTCFGFPERRKIVDAIISNTDNGKSGNIVITGFNELSKEDYSNWINKELNIKL